MKFLLFPTSAVIIPFPITTRPPTDSPQAENIEVIDFQRAQPAILPAAPERTPARPIELVSLRSPPSTQGDDIPELEQGIAPTELPGETHAPEISAGLPMADPRARSESSVVEKGREPASDRRRAIGPARPAAAAEGTGITAAKQKRGMDSLSNSKQGSAFAKRDEAAVEETRPPLDLPLDERTESG